MLLKSGGHGKRWAGVTLATATVGLAAMMVTAAVAAPLSDAAKAKVDSGHWGGTYGGVWIPGPYEKPYTVKPPVSDAAKAKVANGYWGGTYGGVWIPKPYEKSHKANPQLSDAAKAKMSKGHWGGKTGSTWIGPDGKPQ